METRKQAILAALDSFVAQRSGMDPNNYGDVASYRSEQRSITRDLHDYRALRAAVGYRDSITADMLLAASRDAFSGRLTISQCTHGSTALTQCGANRKHVWCGDCDPAPSAQCHWCNGRGYSPARHGATVIEYCTGQYFPTEYRKAACAVLARTLWYWTREHAMPAPIAKSGDHTYYPMVPGKLLSAGDWLRANFVREFGRGIASRYFN